VSSKVDFRLNWVKYHDACYTNKLECTLEGFFNEYNYSIADMKKHKEHFNFEHTQKQCDIIIQKKLNELMEAWLT